MCTCQYDRTRPVIQVVDVDDLRVRILNVRYGEANTLRRLKRSDEAGNRDGKCNRHLNADRRRSVVSLGCLRRDFPAAFCFRSISGGVALPAKKGRRKFTAAQRKAKAARMRAYWAKRKKQGK